MSIAVWRINTHTYVDLLESPQYILYGVLWPEDPKIAWAVFIYGPMMRILLQARPHMHKAKTVYECLECCRVDQAHAVANSCGDADQCC